MKTSSLMLFAFGIMSISVLSADDGNVKPDDGRILPPPVPGPENSYEVPDIPPFAAPYSKPVPIPGLPVDKLSGDEPCDDVIVTFGFITHKSTVIRGDCKVPVTLGTVTHESTVIQGDCKVPVTLGAVTHGSTVIRGDCRVPVTFGSVTHESTVIRGDCRVPVELGSVNHQPNVIHRTFRVPTTVERSQFVDTQVNDSRVICDQPPMVRETHLRRSPQRRVCDPPQLLRPQINCNRPIQIPYSPGPCRPEYQDRRNRDFHADYRRRQESQHCDNPVLRNMFQNSGNKWMSGLFR